MPKRELNLENFDQIKNDVQNLLARGYESHGKWNLAQTCKHLNCWMSYPMDGFPKVPLFLKPVMWAMKTFMGKKQLRKVLQEGAFKEGLPTMPKTVFESDDSSDQDAVEEFLETVDRFKTHGGPFQESPLFGPMNTSDCKKLQLIHCQHHLAFLTPARS